MSTILLVDDDRYILQHLSAMIDSFGHTAISTIYPESLFDMLDSESIDLILLDIFMPQIDGISLLKQLKKHFLYHKIPVIVLTGDARKELLEECFSEGAIDYINKPINDIVLKARINSALSIRNQIQEIETVNDLLRRTFEGLAEGVASIDIHYNIQMISNQACKMLDLEEQEAIGKPAVTVFGASVVGPFGVLRHSLDNPKETTNIQTQLFTKSGRMIPVNLSIISIGKRDSVTGWLVLFRDIRQEERKLRQKSVGMSFGRMVSCTPVIKEIFNMIEEIATSQTTVLVQGESGTGKELVAREIHDRSQNAQGTFVAVNCAAISPHLMESEFFGHEKGAFTGAHQKKVGRFELAHGGTLLLDEVGDIPLELQGKLLRVLEEQAFERVGGTKTIPVNVRIVAATNRNLEKMVQEKLFREDLYYRLNVIPIDLPPLRERLQDVPLLVSFFMEGLNQKNKRQVKHISSEVMQQFLRYKWPGNIRELYNALEFAYAVSRGAHLQSKHFPSVIFKHTRSRNTPALPKNKKELILHALQQANFDVAKAANILGIHRSTLYRQRKRYNI